MKNDGGYEDTCCCRASWESATSPANVSGVNSLECVRECCSRMLVDVTDGHVILESLTFRCDGLDNAWVNDCLPLKAWKFLRHLCLGHGS